ncbi:TPA: methyltransferase [Candidatus Dependentiae bacterium]|nr:methyltransferase [Candidatus Dependentiae bacterium]
MPNEKKTENLTRKFLTNVGIFDNDDFIVEEQRSDNPVIQKLLKAASKSGSGLGKPEFIIRKKDDDEFLLIIECKAKTKFHESINKDRYSDYAVDGALLYASNLATPGRFNVLAIGISGEDINNYKISTYFQPQGAKKAGLLLDENGKPITEIIEWDRYIARAKFDPAVAKNRHSNLIKFSRDLHEYLRDYAKITEAQKPLLVSGVLLALMDKGFEKAYITYEGEDLAQKTFQAIRDIIGKAELGENQESKKKAIVNAFRFIEDHPELHKVDQKKNESPLKHIVSGLCERVKPFTRDHYDFDIIGNFYGEFIRYTGGDKQGLGIVLTPKHITNLFADLAKVNKNSVVLDICAGTAGFLISAMKKMTKDVSADEKKYILEHSLIGIEQEPSMFALAVSNMILRGDGKTNLYQGDSLKDQNILNKIRGKADIGFINPPYSQKGEDVSEWHFIIQMLDLLQTKGTGIAIVPMQLAIDTNNPLREKLLNNHRLEAVMSMPDDLFYPVGVVTCIMVFTAHVPHNSDIHHESWFGYWKNDGFKKVKHEGRVSTEKWSDIKNEWLKTFSEKTNTPGKCVRKKVAINNQWCAEVYLDTDYSDLSADIFIRSVLSYSAYLLMNKKFSLVREILAGKKVLAIKLNTKSWKIFSYPDVFDLEKGYYNNRPEIDPCGIPFISATENNNGITDFVTREGTKIFLAKSITVSNDGSIGNAFYQDSDFTCSHSVNIIRIHKKFKKELNQYIALFLIPLIQKEKFRFNYGFKWRIERMKESKIKLPVGDNGEPDWNFMEEYIKSLSFSSNL